MASADDLIRVYERRLADFEARLAAIEHRDRQRPAPSASQAPSPRQGAGGYRLGVDVGGTFTDLLLLDEKRSRLFAAKVPSTPSNSSIGVLDGIEKICREAGIDPTEIDDVMHGTTVATNTVLTKAGARVGLVTTKGFRDVLQIARSYVPGGLGGWVIYNKPPPLAPLELTIEATERIGADGSVLIPLDEAALRRDLADLGRKGIEALTVSLFNAYVDGRHERRIAEIARDVMPGIPVSISSDVIPEMYEYERAETTVVNSYIKPVVSKYVHNLERELSDKMSGVRLHILRSDGGLSSARSAMDSPVNLLMSGPAGGVAGALGIATHAGFSKLLTFDMGGTSTDVALIENGLPQTRRETRVGDVTVRAPSIDVRTVGAGGGSIAYVPELTKALRVGPQSAGAAPGPAAYRKGGTAPTVTDANVVLGYLPADSKLGGDMTIDRGLAEKAVQTIADALGLGLEKAAEGVINIVNENMCGALRLVSIEQGYDPRDFALIAFGGAGPLHANALAKLINSWPVIVPPGPGVLCAYGDATTRLRNEASRTLVQRLEFAHRRPGARGARRTRRGGAQGARLRAGEGFGAGDALPDRHALFRPGHEAHGRRDARRFPRRGARRRREALRPDARAVVHLRARRGARTGGPARRGARPPETVHQRRVAARRRRSGRGGGAQDARLRRGRLARRCGLRPQQARGGQPHGRPRHRG